MTFSQNLQPHIKSLQAPAGTIPNVHNNHGGKGTRKRIKRERLVMRKLSWIVQKAPNCNTARGWSFACLSKSFNFVHWGHWCSGYKFCNTETYHKPSPCMTLSQFSTHNIHIWQVKATRHIAQNRGVFTTADCPIPILLPKVFSLFFTSTDQEARASALL